jgi:glycosyltransferase involved in cell wall biosynthesis
MALEKLPVGKKNIDCIYIMRTDLPGTSAHTVHVMKISEELSKIYGGRFCCLVRRKSGSDEEICAKYGTQVFDIRELGDKCDGKLHTYRFAWQAYRFMRKNGIKRCITRDPMTAVFLGFAGINTVLDLHGDVRHLCGRGYHFFKLKNLVCRKNMHFMAISNGIKDAYIKEYGAMYEKMHIFADGVTIENFADLTQENVLRRERITLGYIGKFSVGKGIGLIADIAKECGDCTFLMCGGSREDAERETGKRYPENVEFMGYIDNKDVPDIMERMDIMLLPNKADQVCAGEQIGAYTSPLKMFEYMASGRPLIASDIPVLREVLDETDSFLAADGDVEGWVRTIKKIAADRVNALLVAAKAREDVKKYTWKARAEAMAEILNNQRG